MIEWTNGKITELIDLMRGAAVLASVAMVIYAYLKFRTLIAVLVAAITAGIFLFVVNRPDWWQARVDEESGAPAPAVVEATTPAGLPGGWLVVEPRRPA